MYTAKMLEKANMVAEVLNNRGYQAEITIVNKNGDERIGVVLGEGRVRVNMYPDFDTDASIENIANYIVRVYKENEISPDMFNDWINDFVNYENIKKSIIPYLSGGIMEDMVTRKYLDLNVYYKTINGDFSITIKKEHLDKWGITEEDLFKQSKKNMVNKINLKDMADIIPMPEVMRNEMYVLTTVDMKYGSSALLFPDLFNGYEEIIGKRILILPSSIHELILIKDDEEKNPNTQYMVDMIKEINATEVMPDEVLSDHPYLYENGAITEVR